MASLSSEKSGKSLRRPWGLQIIGRAKPSAALPFRLQRAGFYYYYYSAFAFETTRLSPVYLYFLINRGFGDGGVEKKKRGQQPLSPSFCSLGKARCVEALPVRRRVVKTFYEQTMSVYWNHMITEMGSFIVFSLKSVCSPSPSHAPRPGSHYRAASPAAPPGPEPPNQPPNILIFSFPSTCCHAAATRNAEKHF